MFAAVNWASAQQYKQDLRNGVYIIKLHYAVVDKVLIIFNMLSTMYLFLRLKYTAGSIILIINRYLHINENSHYLILMVLL